MWGKAEKWGKNSVRWSNNPSFWKQTTFNNPFWKYLIRQLNTFWQSAVLQTQIFIRPTLQRRIDRKVGQKGNLQKRVKNMHLPENFKSPRLQYLGDRKRLRRRKNMQWRTSCRENPEGRSKKWSSALKMLDFYFYLKMHIYCMQRVILDGRKTLCFVGSGLSSWKMKDEQDIPEKLLAADFSIFINW